MYHLFMNYEGIYIFYLIPIGYFMIIVLHVLRTRLFLPKQFGIKDLGAAIIIFVILADFIHYLYLFITKTGQLLPLNALFVKYVIGFFLWLWVLWYCYEGYFTRRVAGQHFRKRRATLVWIGAGSLVFAVVGGLLS